MNDNVTKFYTADAAKDPDNVLEQAVGVYESVVIIGVEKDGDLLVSASTNIGENQILWLLERFKHKLMAGDYHEEEPNEK